MEGRQLILALVVICGFVALHSAELIATTNGGGTCLDNYDCNNGLCHANNNNGICDCFLGFSGDNCEAKTSETFGPVVSGATETKTKPKKRTHIRHHHLTGSKRDFDYDPGSNVFGLNPTILATKEQECLIFNPDKKKYLFISKDVKLTGKHNVHVEGRDDRDGERNIFLLQKVAGKANTFNIKNKDTKKYVYMSDSKSGLAFKFWNNEVLGGEETVPTAADQKKKYEFVITDEDGDGFYKIMNDKKSLYLSDHRVGIPLNRILKATDQKELSRWKSQFFQFSLREKATDVKLEATGGVKKDPQTVSDASQFSKVCNDGVVGKDPDLEQKIDYTEAITETRTYTETEGFTFGGALKDTYGGFTFTYSKTQATTDTQTETKSITKSIAIKVPAAKCACLAITYRATQYDQDYVVQVTTKQKKVLKATGKVKGLSYGQFEVHNKLYDFKKDFKCPYETK